MLKPFDIVASAAVLGIAAILISLAGAAWGPLAAIELMQGKIRNLEAQLEQLSTRRREEIATEGFAIIPKSKIRKLRAALHPDGVQDLQAKRRLEDASKLFNSIRIREAYDAASENDVG